jgi:hypothetical protein
VNNQKDALIERKEVAQKTKDFRKLDDAAKLGEIKVLLKCMSLLSLRSGNQQRRRYKY